MKTQITKNTDHSTEWLVDVNEVIDNPDSLEFYLKKIGADFDITEDGIFAYIEDCERADKAAENDFAEIDA